MRVERRPLRGRASPRRRKNFALSPSRNPERCGADIYIDYKAGDRFEISSRRPARGVESRRNPLPNPVPETEPVTPLMQAFVARRSELRRLFLVRTRSETDADDLVQELFLKVAGIEDGRVDNPPAYLYRLALNLLTDERRRRARVLRRDSAWQQVSLDIVGDEIRSRAPSQEEQLGHKQRLALLGAAIERLPPGTREVFRLHKLEGLSYAEVATRLGISRSGVEKQMMRALRQLLAAAPEDWT